MVWTMSPLRRTITISLSSPRERSNAIMSPTGDQTGFESLRPAAMGTSGRTNCGSTPAGSACSSANTGSAAAASKTSRERTSSLFLDLVAVAARRLAGLHESGIGLELFREEVEVLAPRQAGAVHHRRLLRDQVQLVVGQRRVVVGVVHRFVVLRAREEARVLPRGLQRLDRLGELVGRGVAIARHQAVAFLAIRMAEVGEGDRELLVDELLVLRQREHGLELGNRGVVVLLVVEVYVAQAPARLGVIRVLAAGGGIGLDGALDVAFLARALAELEEILLQHDAALAGAVLLLLGELHDLEEVAVVLAVGQAHAVKAERDQLAAGDRCPADLLVVDVDGRRRRRGVKLEQDIVGREQELARFAALVDFDLVGELLVAVAVQRERIVAAQPQGDLRLTVRTRRTGPLAVQVDAGARKGVDVRADAALRGEQEVGASIALVAFAPGASHHAIADLHFLALLECCDLGERARIFAALDLDPAGLAVSRHLAALTERRRGQGELGAAADTPVLADVDAIAIILLTDYRALEREALDNVVCNVAHRAVDPAGAAGARDLRENDFAVCGVEFDLDQVAAIVLGDAPERDHVHGRAQGSVLPALGRDALDTELALIDLGLQPLRRHLAERRELEQLCRQRLLGLGCDLLQVHARRVADDAVESDTDRFGRSRVEVALEVDLTFKPDGGFPHRGNIAGRCERDHGLLAWLALVVVRVAALRVGLADGLAVYAHAQARHPARAAILVGQRLDCHHSLAVERDFDDLAWLELTRRAVGAVTGLGDVDLGSLRRLLLIDVHEFAFGIGDAFLFPADRHLGLGQRRTLLAYAQGDVTHRLEIGLDAVRVDLIPLRQLHEEGRFPWIDAIAGRFLDHRHFNFATGLLAQPLREHALGVCDAKLLAIYSDLRLCRGLAVDTRLDLDVEALAAAAEQGDEQDGKKSQVSCGHEESLGYGAGSKGHGGCVRSHRGRLDIDLAGIDDLVFVGGGTFDRLPLGLLDLRQLELDLLSEEGADLDRLGLRLVADAARLHLVEAGLDTALGRLIFALLVHRRGARSLIDRGGRIDHVDHCPLRALVRDRLLTAVNELHRAMNRGGTAGHHQQGGD